MVSEHKPGSITCPDDVLITGELAQRPSRAPDFAAENRALAVLAAEMANRPQGVLQKLAELVIELCRADSAGISILEAGGEHGQFRWHAAAGAFAPYLGGTMPREASPCGIVVERASVLLFDRAERCFPALRESGATIYENLLVPWNIDGETVGTVWAIGHVPERHFDSEDARLLQSLANAVAQRVRADARFAGMKIIALTGWGQQVDRAKSHTNGIDHHLTKPVDWKALESLLAAR